MNSLMQSLPLVFADPDQILLYRQQGDNVHTITARQFMAEARALAVDLAAEPGAHHPIVNLCQDRYRFMVGFAATILAGKTNLLPSTYTGETLRQIFVDAPNALCLHDHEDWPFPYAHLFWAHRRYQGLSADGLGESGQIGAGSFESGQIKPEHVAAQVFTSGSTGLPMPHNKTWGKLVRNVEAAMQQLALSSPMSLVGTVPPQHMFGFESLVLLCLIGRCPLWSGKPFYPADIVAALDAMPEPRMLVTTPFHLQALLDAEIALPKIDRLLLATAPLSPELAERAERLTGAPLFEIYGSTETGQIATRRPTQSSAWRLFPGITLTKAHPDEDDELFIAEGGHIEVPVMLSDRVRLEADGQFHLLGRVADQINMVGKRSSLNYLTAQLKAIDGVTDGVFFLPKPKKDRAGKDQVITRLCAVVVAPDLSMADILAALRERLDPVFLPRPLILVESLPYNATGKLPQIALQALLDQHLATRGHLAKVPNDQTQWHIPADHPVFAGHFPGHPLVPGALLLDWVVERVAAHWRISSTGLRIEQAKFLHTVLPDARVVLDLKAEADRCRFTLNLVDGETNTVAVTGLLSRPPHDGAGDTGAMRA
jgi:acyl-CoA synthetase (AMP-forming)/AMP-acid ligase II